MGVDISDGMIVGADASEVKKAMLVDDDWREKYGTEGNYHEEFYDWYKSVGMESYSLCYDADENEQVIGFLVKDVKPISDEFNDWVHGVGSKAIKFSKLTGLDCELIGMQNVW